MYYRGCWHIVSRCFLFRYCLVSSLMTIVYNPKTFFLYAASLRQSFLHCAIFPTAASRRSLGRISVPMWPFNLSVRLLIVALVGRCPTNQLIRRKPIYQRITPFLTVSCDTVSICGISNDFSLLFPSDRQVAYVLLTSPPLTALKVNFELSPFDLHVLCAPPAFILSQDQTLMLMVSIFFNINRFEFELFAH